MTGNMENKSGHGKFMECESLIKGHEILPSVPSLEYPHQFSGHFSLNGTRARSSQIIHGGCQSSGPRGPQVKMSCSEKIERYRN